MRQGNRGRLVRVAGIGAAAIVLASACSSGAGHRAVTPPAVTPRATPGQVLVRASGVDLDVRRVVAHLDAVGDGTLTMTVRNGSGVPEHLDMVATPDAGRGSLRGATKGEDGALTDGGILLPAGSTVVFGGAGAKGPTIGLSGVQGVTATHTLPLILQFGVARLVRVSAVVAAA